MEDLANEVTMSSREIAEITGKDIKHIHRDIKTQLIEGLYGIELKAGPNLDRLDLKGIFIKQRDNGQISEIRLNRYHADILVSGYEVKYRAAIVKRWHELEEKEKNLLNPANMSRLQLIQIALQSEQERLAMAEKIEVIEPKADAFDRLSAADGSQCITDAAKALKIPPKDLFKKLHAMGWIYKRTGGNRRASH
jgi:phage regulator Rha-like protein